MVIDPNSIAITTNTNTTTTAVNTSTTTTRSFTNPHQQQRPPQQLHHLHHHPQHPHYSTHPSLYTTQPLPIRPLSHTPTQPSFLYPVASSGRGFINRLIRPLPTSDQAVTVANPNSAGYFYRPLVGLHQTASAGCGLRPHLDSSNHNNSVHMLRPPHSFQQQHIYQPHLVSSGVAVKGVPVCGQSKVVSTASVPDSNSYQGTGEQNKDDNVVIVSDRKVRITDGASLYAHCGSWLRNNLPEKCQSQYGDAIRSVPQSLPVPTASDIDPKEEVQEEEEGEDEESVRHLSKEDILKRHIKRAKRVRARLREKRLQRIARYKSRLALLLPPLMEQQFRNDAAAGT